MLSYISRQSSPGFPTAASQLLVHSACFDVLSLLQPVVMLHNMVSGVFHGGAEVEEREVSLCTNRPSPPPAKIKSEPVLKSRCVQHWIA